MSDRKLIGEWEGRVTVYQSDRIITIQIYKVPNEKNKVVILGVPGPWPTSQWKNIDGSLLSAEKLNTKNTYQGLNAVAIRYQKRGSYQDGPTHSYKDRIVLFSKEEKKIDELIKFLQKHITKGKVRKVRKVRKTKRGKRGGTSRKRTIKKSKKKENSDTAYFEYKDGSSRKFWRIVKNGSKITTHYGKLGTLGQMTTKDYGSKVDQSFDSLIQSKKGKGYVESMDFGDKDPKPPSKIQREYMKICRKAERSSKLNPNRINSDCEGMLDQGQEELIWQTGWYKDALKKGDYDWPSYEEHSKSNRKQNGGADRGRSPRRSRSRSRSRSRERGEECPVCFESSDLNKYYNCDHGICAGCFENWVKTKNLKDYTSNCPLCRGGQTCKIEEGVVVDNPFSHFCLECELSGPGGSHTDTCSVTTEQGEPPIVDPDTLTITLEPEDLD